MRISRRTALIAVAVQVAGGLVVAAPTAVARSLPPSEWVVGPQNRVALLTFDGRTRSKALIRVLQELSDRGARATFFLPGSYVGKNPNKARLVLAGNHKLGNAGWGKERFTSMS